MANSKQATKRARQADKHRANNRWQLSRMMTAVKQVIMAIEKKDKEAATALYKNAVSLADSLANKGLIHANKASRYKSRLNSHIKAIA